MSLCVMMHNFVCVLLQYACECVNNENLMKPTCSVGLQYIAFSILSARLLTKPPPSFLSQCCKVQVRATKSIDLSARMPSELIIKELSELEAGKGI